MNKKGQVLSFGIDDIDIIPYILGTLNNTEFAFKLVSHANLLGADDLYVKQFWSGRLHKAAKVLRTLVVFSALFRQSRHPRTHLPEGSGCTGSSAGRRRATESAAGRGDNISGRSSIESVRFVNEKQNGPG